MDDNKEKQAAQERQTAPENLLTQPDVLTSLLKNLQPFLGPVGGLVAGYLLFAKDKESKIEELKEKIARLKEELQHYKDQMKESKHAERKAPQLKGPGQNHPMPTKKYLYLD